MESFQKICQQSHLFIRFVNGYQRPINRWLGHKLKREFWLIKMFYPLKRLREFCLAKMSYPLKRQWERFQKNFIVKCSLKRNHWPNTCKIYKDSYMIFIVIFFSWRENSSSILLIQWDWLRDCESLVVKDSWTQGMGCPCVVQTL